MWASREGTQCYDVKLKLCFDQHLWSFDGEVNFTEAMHYVLSWSPKIEPLKPEQEESVRNFIEGEDVVGLSLF